MENHILLKVGTNHTIKQIATDLIDFGYEKVILLSRAGEFSINGGMVKIFPSSALSPVTVDFFGDTIEKIFSFDPISQKKIDELKEATILRNSLTLDDRSILIPEDYVVHIDHGIGLFRRVSVRKVEDERIIYAEIEYLNGDILYVPITQIEKLTRYIGVGKRKPKLSKLGSVTWKKNYKKIYDDAIKVARELLIVYAKRELVQKTPRIINQEWEREVALTFDFEETIDQKKSIEQVYFDLQSSKPMDRLLCGDVGFGKTEVALRTTVQSVANGYQVVVLVPTTILCEQHFATFSERLANLPIKIERLSRFVVQKNQSEIVEQSESGKIDILIGTQAILRKNIKFKNLGLLIIDEEQKFGVKDKEKLKKMREEIDVLSLTATPIPRTLFMSLSGLRDISLISSIPIGRKPVETEVGVSHREKIVKYIEREMERKGQVYYLHNDVSTIISIQKWLKKEFPQAEIGIAHGQMREEDLANAMRDFAQEKIKILVCSTIIENGLDLPNANTLIADEADRFGLSQLYQIRGRIGRSPKQSYALFTYREKCLTNNAVKRLKALVDNTELGLGYNIATADLEIRGGGNVLGREQHGSMEAVGLILYSKLLAQAVLKLKNKEI